MRPAFSPAAASVSWVLCRRRRHVHAATVLAAALLAGECGRGAVQGQVLPHSCLGQGKQRPWTLPTLPLPPLPPPAAACLAYPAAARPLLVGAAPEGGSGGSGGADGALGGCVVDVLDPDELYELQAFMVPPVFYPDCARCDDTNSTCVECYPGHGLFNGTCVPW